MNISTFIAEFKSSLANHYSEGELEQLSIHIFEDVMGYRRIDLALKKDEELPEVILEKLKAITSELKSNKPIQYILGYAWFAGIKFKVNPAVLIPRQETEELVEWIVKENSIGSPTVVDICSGSGCIGIAIKKMIPSSNVKGIDISTSAIELSRDNSDTLDIKVDFLEADILKLEIPYREVDIIVSNPPYVRSSEAALMKANVLEHEPHLALFVTDQDPLLFYKRLAKIGKESLKPGGKMYLEINENLGKETAEILELNGFHDISIRKDLNDKFRMIRAVK